MRFFMLNPMREQLANSHNKDGRLESTSLFFNILTLVLVYCKTFSLEKEAQLSPDWRRLSPVAVCFLSSPAFYFVLIKLSWKRSKYGDRPAPKPQVSSSPMTRIKFDISSFFINSWVYLSWKWNVHTWPVARSLAFYERCQLFNV